MEDSDELVEVATFLTESESESLKARLISENILPAVSSHGPRSQYREYYFQVRVHKRDLAAAQQIVCNFMEHQKKASQACPNCKQVGHRVIPKRGIWERLYYLGTTRVQCTKCNHKYFI